MFVKQRIAVMCLIYYLYINVTVANNVKVASTTVCSLDEQKIIFHVIILWSFAALSILIEQQRNYAVDKVKIKHILSFLVKQIFLVVIFIHH